jgi:hypothetical protein
VLIRDENSSHGTFLHRVDGDDNGSRIRNETELKTGDIIRFGEIVTRAAGTINFFHPSCPKLTFTDTFFPPQYHIRIESSPLAMSLLTPPQQEAEHGLSYTHPEPTSDPTSDEDNSDDEEDVTGDEGFSEEIEIPSSDAADLDDDLTTPLFKSTSRVPAVSTSNRMSVSNLVSGPEAAGPSRGVKRQREIIIIDDSSDDEYDMQQDLDDMIEQAGIDTEQANIDIEQAHIDLDSPEFRPTSAVPNQGIPPQVIDLATDTLPLPNFASYPQQYSSQQPIYFTLAAGHEAAELYSNTPVEVINTQPAAQLPSLPLEHQTIDINENLNIHQTVEVKQPDTSVQRKRRRDVDEVERPRKRIRSDLIVTGAACFVGGAVSLLATLSALPEGYFENFFS